MTRAEYLEERARRLTAALREVEQERAALGASIMLRRDEHHAANLSRLASGLPLRPAWLP